jgi:hypothetical protein
MTAENVLGSSLEAMALNGVSPSSGAAQRPNAPTGIGASAGDGQARVFWSAPSNNGGSIITQFTVTASPGGASSTVSGFHRTGAVVTGLSNGVPYTFTVTASNAVGIGTASSASDPVTPSAGDTDCPLAANTSIIGTAPTGCAILERDATACEASRTAQGLSGFWLRFSCRVTLTKTTVSGQSVVQLSSDGWPDYGSKYFAASHPCREEYPTAHTTPGTLVASSYTMNIPLNPTSSGAQTQGSIGLAVNGVFMFDNEAAPGDDIYEEAVGFDRCSGHPNSTGYHYHSEPWAISYDDDAFIGVLRDGYPLYGRRDPDGTYPTLDSNGGHTGATLDSPVTATYHYHVNAQTSTTTGSAGHVRWFLTGGRYRGTPGLCSGC